MGKGFRPAGRAGVLIAAGLLLAGCTAPRPVVTFYGNRTAVTVAPELWCPADPAALTVSCPQRPDTAQDGHLRMRSGQLLQINVPGEVGSTPWVVVFEYQDAAGEAQNGRSELIADHRLSYTLPPLGPDSQLTRVEVQAGLIPTLDAAGGTVIAASRTWVLVVRPAAPPSATGS